MSITVGHISSLGFIHTNVELSYNVTTNEVRYITAADGDVEGLNEPGVYLVVHESSGEQISVVYVGKAGKGLNKRFREHDGGYKRNKRNKITAAGTQQLIRSFESLQTARLSVWFRKSSVKPLDQAVTIDGNKNVGLSSVCVSMYSSEEEALILHFLISGQPLINRSRPREMTCAHAEALSVSDNFPKLEALTKQLCENSLPKLIEKWRVAVADWDTPTTENFCAALQGLKEDPVYRGQTPKIIGLYSSGPFRNEPILVFGELANTNFRAGTNNLIFTLDGKYMAQYPFDTKRIMVISLNDYCAL